MYQTHEGQGAANTAITAAASESDKAHCERVATLARELAAKLGFESALEPVESTARLHHHLPQNIAERSGMLSDSLSAVHGLLPCGGSAEAFLHGEIVRLANAFDEMLEWLEFEPQSINHVLGQLDAIAPVEGWRPDLMRALRETSRDRFKDLLAAGQKLPVSAVAAVRKLAYTPVEDLTVDALYRVALGDPALAADVMRTVHSAAYHTLRGDVGSLRTAIIHLGAEKTRTVLMASLARGVFASSNIRNLWQHSLAVAAEAEKLALLCNCDAETAMLAGLLHDVGRLAAEKLDAETMRVRARMKERGAPTVWIDLVTCRHEHAEVGGRLLANWGFSREIVDGIAHHHSPERSSSKLASILYLAEQQCEENEDMPSLSRMKCVLKRLALPKWPVAEAVAEQYHSARTA